MDNANVGKYTESISAEASISGVSAFYVIKRSVFMIRINGNDITADGKTVAEYLESENYKMERIVVEINGNIIPKSTYAETILKDGDTVEVVSFVGGG